MPLPCPGGTLFPARDLPVTVRVWRWKTPRRCASTGLTALCSASTLLIVFVDYLDCVESFFQIPFITEVIVASRNKIKGA